MSELPSAQAWRRSARTRDGRLFAIRPIRIEDAQRDRDFLLHLSADSRYKRMMGVCREPSPELIDRLVHVDQHGSMAFVAVAGGDEGQREAQCTDQYAGQRKGQHNGQHKDQHKGQSERDTDAQVIIGAARYAATPGGDEAEFAIAVADEWQSGGVGSALLQRLIEYARSQGLHRLQGVVLANNWRMLEFARKHGFLLRPVPGEYTLVEITKDL